jgi:hypothetical protein
MLRTTARSTLWRLVQQERQSACRTYSTKSLDGSGEHGLCSFLDDGTSSSVAAYLATGGGKSCFELEEEEDDTREEGGGGEARQEEEADALRVGRKAVAAWGEVGGRSKAGVGWCRSEMTERAKSRVGTTRELSGCRDSPKGFCAKYVAHSCRRRRRHQHRSKHH